MEMVRIEGLDKRRSWSVVDEAGNVIQELRDWVIHLEQINYSPNTIKSYLRHVVRLGNYLEGNKKTFATVTIRDYDNFLHWLPWLISQETTPGANIIFLESSKPKPKLSISLKNQTHLAVKAFYGYFFDCVEFQIRTKQKPTVYDDFKPNKGFLDHINRRKLVRVKDTYNNGDIGRVQRRVHTRRLVPEQVLEVVKTCRLLRDTFLVVLLYNTGMRIGEALGLRHVDIDMHDKVIWIVMRTDNQNGARSKSKRTRVIPVLDYVVNMYEDFIVSDEYLHAFESGTEYVFCNVQKPPFGKALSLSYADKLQRYLCQRSGVNFTWHMFRHTHASEAIAEGYSLLEVAERLGHLSPQTTLDFYSHLFSAEVRKMHLKGPQRLSERLKEIETALLLKNNMAWI